jgi:hypothetical protein
MLKKSCDRIQKRTEISDQRKMLRNTLKREMILFYTILIGQLGLTLNMIMMNIHNFRWTSLTKWTNYFYTNHVS